MSMLLDHLVSWLFVGALGGAFGYFAKGAVSDFRDSIKTQALYPVFHRFDEVGVDGQVAFDFNIYPADRHGSKDPLRYQKLYLGGIDEPVQRLGSFVVELTQKGFRLRWQAVHPGEEAPAVTIGSKRRASGTDEPTHREHEAAERPLHQVHDCRVHAGDDSRGLP